MINEYKVTQKLFRSWGRENMLKGANLYLCILWCVLTAASFLFSLGGNYFFILVALFCSYRAFFRNMVITSAQYKRLADVYGTKNWIRRISFEEKGIFISEENSTIKYEYTDISSIKEKDNRIWLLAKNRTVIRLYKDCFVLGNWEEVKADLLEKTRQY